ncbi:MAG TPA: NAD-dependent epimerase/dehydratase family protein, partial [Gemmatales bacterium]|nr:NAD-dependent epimerase/dehydratase family protein [Gemmatales bacterium]
MEKCHLVTGATGLLGSHLAEQLVQAGHRVRALVRPSSQTSFLQSLGVECVTGDLTEPESLLKACQSVDTIFHSAAKVGDWGTRAEFEKYTIAGTRHIAEAALQS